MKETFENGPWFVEYDLSDGARINRLCFRGFDLLATAPSKFEPPSKDFGEYENRPVYGYDDCFPSVESCKYPGMDWTIPDHGELCWLDWDAEVQTDKIIFSVESEALPIFFKRTLHFKETQLTWHFEVENKGDVTLPFQHVIHPLLKLTEIKDLRFPRFDALNNETGKKLKIKTPEALRDFLLSSHEGETYMLYAQNPERNYVKWIYKNDLQVQMEYTADEFSSIGIWWNHLGYPDEEGCRRDECAFEPIPGSSSKLMEAHDAGGTLAAGPGETKVWDIVWKLESKI